MPKAVNKVNTVDIKIRGVDPAFWWRVKAAAADKKQTLREFVLDACTRAMRGKP